jgi:ribose/xylose/arabinose/galactoside ABC-type transport system permease subunit
VTAGWRRRAPAGRDVYPFALLAAALLALFVFAPMTGAKVGSFNIYNIFQLVADYGLVALALGLTMIAGEYDISVAGIYAVGGVVAVCVGQNSPVLGLLAATGVGVISGAVQGGVVTRLQMSSVPVTLGGYLTLAGLAVVISNDTVLNYKNFNVGLRLDEPVLSVFSIRSLIVLAAFVIVGLLMRLTTFGMELRAIGGDRRGARTSGVKVKRVLFGILVASGALSALGGGMAAYSLSSANPNIGLTPLIFATIAVLLGGVALSGGRGSAWGILAGVAAYGALQETLAILGTADWLADLVTGALLLAVTIATAPDLGRVLVAARSRSRSSRTLKAAARVGRAAVTTERTTTEGATHG